MIMLQETKRVYFIQEEKILQGWPCEVTITKYAGHGGRPDWGEVWIKWDHEPKSLATQLPIQLMRKVLELFDQAPQEKTK